MTKHRLRRSSDCSAARLHTPCPEGYLAWHEWAERMSKTHTQRKCVHCGLYAIWVPKKASRRPLEAP